MREARVPLALGLIGCGRIAQAHLAAAAHLSGQVRLAGVADPVPGRADDAARRYSIPLATEDYRRLLEDPAVEAVIVTVPNDLHAAVVGDAAAAGKHVLVEKPMALDAVSAREMVAAAEVAGVALMVGQSRRFPSAVLELVRRLPDLGEIFRIHIAFLVSFPQPPTDWWRSEQRAGGLVILLQGSHSLDSVCWWVYATATRRNPAWEGEDEADILCAFPGGVSASVHLSLSTDPPVHEALVVGTRGNLRLIERPGGAPFEFTYRLELNGRILLDGPQSPSMYTHQLREFAEAIREKRSPLASGEEILPLMRVLDAARASARTGLPVSLG
ncbi:MAG: Gfo/Idh/MocA family oxidoreductase [candidate division NC10 bacterium]|nr:Gfo/Idh/MocA family oxidoreductase [candidate division NC10 bacterium]